MGKENRQDKVLDPTCGGMPEFIGFTKGESGILCISAYVIANLDPSVRKAMKIPPELCAVGMISSRFGGAPIAMVLDDILKSSQSVLLQGEFVIEALAAGGHGSFFLVGSRDADDVRDVIQKTFDHCTDMYGGIGAGETTCYDLHFSSLTGDVVCASLPGAEPAGRWCMVDAIPKGLGMVALNEAVKSAGVEIRELMTPYTDNDFGAGLKGDTATCLTAVRKAREITAAYTRMIDGSNPVPLGGTYF